MATTIDVKDLPTRLAELAAAAAAGEEVIITEGDVPRARLAPLQFQSPWARFTGSFPGAFVIGPDFDDPLPDEFWLGGLP